MRSFKQYLHDITAPQADDLAEWEDGTSYTPMSMPLIDLSKASVRHYGAMMSTDFLACETAKARAVRSLPVHVLKRTDAGRIPADDHPLSKVLHRPNSFMSLGDLLAWAFIRRDVLGTCYIKVYRDIYGDPVEIRPVTGSVSLHYDRATGTMVYASPGDEYNEPWTCREDGIVVLKTDYSADGGKTGESIAEQAANDIGLSIDLANFYRSLMQNGNHFGGYLEADGKLTIEDRKAIRESLDESRGPENAGKLPIFDRGAKYHDVQVQLAGMDIVAQERFILEKVCRACHVDMHHVYADDTSTATAASGADIDFAKHTVLPEVNALEQAFQPILDGSRGFGWSDSGYRLKWDLNGLMRGDFQSRMDGYRIGIYAGIFTRAYCASCEDIAALPGQERLLQPTAYYVLDEEGNPTIPDARTEGTSGQSDGVSGIDQKRVMEKLQPVITDAQERIEKRANRDGDTEATRNFAAMVMSPIEQTAALAGCYLMTGQLVDEAIEKGARDA